MPITMATTALTKIELMRKQAEVLAAKRKAAELNVKLLSEHAAMHGSGSARSTREREEAATQSRMEEEMASMKNQGGYKQASTFAPMTSIP